jgi:DNA (cytosine-5)-methyltransferase 3A
MNVLSLFDGISVARVALDYAGIQVKNYYSAEIDKYAIAVSENNYPDIKRLGSVCDISSNTFEPIDLLIGGSPCQDLSIAKKGRKGLDGDRSGLFWEYVRIRDLVKPKYFILENVASMPQKDKDIITEAMGVEPVMFNASLVSAQTRKRLFWTNIKFELPMDRGIILKDILQPDGEVDERMVNKDKKAYTLTATYAKAYEKNSVERKQRTMVKVGHIGNSDGQANRVYSTEGKSVTLSANGGGLGAKTGLYKTEDSMIRKLTPIECERLQSLPDNYTECVSNSQRYKCLGNAFNAQVISWILEHIN